jgi:hypothetical protein
MLRFQEIWSLPLIRSDDDIVTTWGPRNGIAFYGPPIVLSSTLRWHNAGSRANAVTAVFQQHNIEGDPAAIFRRELNLAAFAMSIFKGSTNSRESPR